MEMTYLGVRAKQLPRSADIPPMNRADARWFFSFAFQELMSLEQMLWIYVGVFMICLYFEVSRTLLKPNISFTVGPGKFECVHLNS